MTAPGHFQDTRHVELDLGGSGLRYEPGWLLAVRPRQQPEGVAAFLNRLRLDGEEWVRVEAAEPHNGSVGVAAEVRLPACNPPWYLAWLLVSNALGPCSRV